MRSALRDRPVRRLFPGGWTPIVVDERPCERDQLVAFVIANCLHTELGARHQIGPQHADQFVRLGVEHLSEKAPKRIHRSRSMIEVGLIEGEVVVASVARDPA